MLDLLVSLGIPNEMPEMRGILLGILAWKAKAAYFLDL
jgi:hypothetical protein